MEPLTPAQDELYQYLIEYIGQHQSAPSIREMMFAMGLRSPAPIQSRLEHLEHKGYIVRSTANGKRGIARCVRLVKPAQDGIPLQNKVVDGRVIPLESELNTTVRFVEKLPPYCFAVMVSDQSMSDRLIDAGDILICRPALEPIHAIPQGAMVAVKVPATTEGETTMRMFASSHARVRLKPIDPDDEEVIISQRDVAVQGVVIAVWRTLKLS